MKVQLLDETHECHPACAGATREECVCVCEGRFHGAHWVTFRAQVARDIEKDGGIEARLGRRGALAQDEDEFWGPVAVAAPVRDDIDWFDQD